MALQFHPEYANLLAVGSYDGSVAVYDVHQNTNKPLYCASPKAKKHTDTVWQVCWQVSECARAGCEGEIAVRIECAHVCAACLGCKGFRGCSTSDGLVQAASLHRVLQLGSGPAAASSIKQEASACQCYGACR